MIFRVSFNLSPRQVTQELFLETTDQTEDLQLNIELTLTTVAELDVNGFDLN